MKGLEKIGTGQVMDYLVAKNILEWTEIKGEGATVMFLSPDRYWGFTLNGHFNLLSFSESDSDAVRFVVPALQKRGWLVVIKAMPGGHYFRTQDVEPLTITQPFACETHWQPGGGLENMRRRIHGRQTAFGATMAEAICRAGLLAVEAEKKKF